MTSTPRQAVETLIAERPLAPGDDERFSGYGVMGVPFASGHYLALRGMVASSVGPAYSSIWHRDPDGRWTIHTTGAPELSCPRYFSSVTGVAHAESIDVAWADDHSLDVTLDDQLSWRIELASTPATRTMTAMAGMLPAAGWDSGTVLATMGPMARAMLRSGRVRLRGSAPNGQLFKVAPLKTWRVVGGGAEYGGEELGELGPQAAQTSLGDMWLPQRGIFFVGRARFAAAEASSYDAEAQTGARMSP